jgi:hypothetical protein
MRNRFLIPQYGIGRIASLVLLLGLVSLSAQASKPRSTGTWQEGVPHNLTFKKVLVVGVSPDINARCSFEHILAGRLRNESVQAIASCRVIKDLNPLTRESIEQAVASEQADAVLATLLVSKTWEVDEGGSRDTRGGAYYKATDSGWATGYYGAYGVPVIYGEFQTAPSVFTMKGEVRVTSKLFETRGASIVYTMDTVAKDVESRDRGLSMIAGAIAERLRKDGLTK